MVTAQQLIAKLRTCFDEYAGGIANPTALRKVESILQTISMTCQPNTYAREKISSIREYSGIYFSDRKHQRYQHGAATVKSFIWGDIDTLEDALYQGIGSTDRTK